MSRLNPAITISGREIRQGGRPLLIAEVAQAHDGSLGFAHAFIDVVADAGFDAIKFQTHIAEAESTKDEPFRVPFSYEDATRFDYWRRMEFTPAAMARLGGTCAQAEPVVLELVLLARGGGDDAEDRDAGVEGRLGRDPLGRPAWMPWRQRASRSC